MKRAEIVMETEEAFCPSAEEIERWMNSAFDMVGWLDRTADRSFELIKRGVLP